MNCSLYRSVDLAALIVDRKKCFLDTALQGWWWHDKGCQWQESKSVASAKGVVYYWEVGANATSVYKRGLTPRGVYVWGGWQKVTNKFGCFTTVLFLSGGVHVVRERGCVPARGVHVGRWLVVFLPGVSMLGGGWRCSCQSNVVQISSPKCVV